MNIADYLVPVSEDFAVSVVNEKKGHHILMYKDEGRLNLPPTVKAAILGVPEDRFSGGAGEIKMPEQVRRQFHALTFDSTDSVIDLGSLRTGKNLSDTYYGLQFVVSELADRGIATLIIGGTLDLIHGAYLAFEPQKPTLSVVAPTLRLPEYQEPHPLNAIIFHGDSFPLHFCNIGYQSYYNSQQDLDKLKSFYYETYRLGEVVDDISICEPIARDSDIVAISFNAIRFSDAPAAAIPSPNGLPGELACQIAFYAGLGYSCKALGLFDTLLQNDISNITAKLAAQIGWYFVEGIRRRNTEHPAIAPQNFKKYVVFYDQLHYNLSFYKHLTTGRWWLEVPSVHSDDPARFIACTQDDYTHATEQEIPNRWWNFYQKIN